MNRDHRRFRRNLSERMPAGPARGYDPVRWRIDGCASGSRSGWLVEQSGNGLAMLTEAEEVPPVGARIEYSRRRQHGWVGPAVVVHTERLSELLELVSAEYQAL